MNMNFKEWFKDPADEEAKKKAALLEKIARARLLGNETPNLDILDLEIVGDILYKHPKTNDDAMPEDVAAKILSDSHEYEKVSGGQDFDKDIVEDTARIMVKKLTTDSELLTKKANEVLILKQELFVTERRLADAKIVLIQKSKQAFAQQDEFYAKEFEEVDLLVKELESKKESLTSQISEKEIEVEDLQVRYDSGLNHYYSLTGELMPDEQERLEEQN
jgi:hypothetical protein